MHFGDDYIKKIKLRIDKSILERCF